MSEFRGLVDGGRHLAPVLAAALADTPDPLLLAVLPNGAPVAVGIREGLDIAVQPLPVQRSADGLRIDVDPRLAGRHVVVVDDGVETGTVAFAAAAALAEAGVASLMLAVPVCPSEVLEDLRQRYTDVVAVVRPPAGRSLASHFDDFDTVDDATARALLQALPPI